MCLCNVWIKNLRKSAHKAFGQSMVAKSETRDLSIWAAILRDSTDISDEASRLSSPQVKPSASACQNARLPLSTLPQTTHSENSGRNPISRVIHSSKYVMGIHSPAPRS